VVIGEVDPSLALRVTWIMVQLMVKEIPRYRFGMTRHFF